jgi:gluconokinase
VDRVSTPCYLVMGVAGSGKSTVGAALAAALEVTFVDGDDLHPSANKAKMAAGIALDDVDRGPWLDAIGDVLARGSVVVACSALKRRYRDQLRAAAPQLRLVSLHGTRELLTARLAGRQHEYMPASLLDSQLATLEEPGPDEHPFSYDVALSPNDIVRSLLQEAAG